MHRIIRSPIPPSSTPLSLLPRRPLSHPRSIHSLRPPTPRSETLRWTSLTLGASLIGAGGIIYYTLNSPTVQLESPDQTQSGKGTSRAPPPTLWTPPSRAEMLQALRLSKPLPSEDFAVGGVSKLKEGSNDDGGDDGFDLLVIGGGATGAGVALDAASRGLSVALVERDDWSSGASSKSTKLIHGGVRYLQKAVQELDYEQWKLVREALHERKTFLEVAPYLSHHLPIMLPIYKWWQVPYYWAGCKLYDVLAGRENMESSYFLGKGKALEAFPMLKSDNLVGALVYYDGQHNDSRMNVALIMTAVHQGAVVANHVEVTKLHKKVSAEGGEEKLCGATVTDKLTGQSWDVKAKGIINATGPFSDGVRKLDDPTTKEIVAPSGGVHITLPSYYSPRTMGLLDPATSDGRVIFFLPWQGNAIAGTTDSPTDVTQHPLPKEEEIQWILDEVRNYLSPDIKVRRGDVLSAWSGIRPLVRNPAAKNSESLVRNHMIHVTPSGLLTIAGGKWTTYRAMAQETVDEAIKAFGFDREPGRKILPCQTEKIKLLGSHGWTPNMYIKLIQQFGLESDVAKHLTDTYGDRAWTVCSMASATGKRWPLHGKRLDENYPYLEDEVSYTARREYTETVTDFIARRTRLSFLNSLAALEVVPKVIDLMAAEKGWSSGRKQQEFVDAVEYLKSMGLPEKATKLSIDEVRKGKVAQLANDVDDVFNRAIFKPDEVNRLEQTFKRLDVDGDGKISKGDLKKVMVKVGYGDVDNRTVDQIISEVSKSKSGKISLEDFFDVASGIKEVSLSNAFTQLMKSVEGEESLGAGVGGGNQDPDQASRGPASDEKSWRRWWRRRIPVERSGGGT